MADEPNPAKRRRDTILPERLMRRVLEGVGEVVDRKLGRTVDPKRGLTTAQLIHRMNALIDARVRDEKGKGRIVPHHLKLKVEWGTHSEAPPEVLKRLETEILAAAIDHINDHRYRTLAPMEIETDVDIFTRGIVVDPTFGEFEEELKQQDLERKLGPAAKGVRKENKDEVHFTARVSTSEGLQETPLTLIPGERARETAGLVNLNLSRRTHLNYPSDSRFSASHVARTVGKHADSPRKFAQRHTQETRRHDDESRLARVAMVVRPGSYRRV